MSNNGFKSKGALFRVDEEGHWKLVAEIENARFVRTLSENEAWSMIDTMKACGTTKEKFEAIINILNDDKSVKLVIKSGRRINV